jgi:hypothetical protein
MEGDVRLPLQLTANGFADDDLIIDQQNHDSIGR